MYIQHGIEKLSPAQVSKLLNGHPVRVRHGQHHKIHITEEHAKKILRAHRKGAKATIQLDPYAREHNQHLRGRGSWDTLGDNVAGNLGRLADAGTNRGIRAIDGSGVRRRGRPRKMHGGNVVDDFLSHIGNNAEPIMNYLKPSYADALLDANNGALRHMYGGRAKPDMRALSFPEPTISGRGAWDNLGDNVAGNLGRLADAGTNRGIRAIDGSGVRRRGRPRKMHGGSLFGDISHALTPLAKTAVKTFAPRALSYVPEAFGDAAAAAAVATGNPELAPIAYLAGKKIGQQGAHYAKQKIHGLGIKKRGRPRKSHGGSAHPAGY